MRAAEELRCSVFELEPGLRRNRRALVALTMTALSAEAEADAELARRAAPTGGRA